MSATTAAALERRRDRGPPGRPHDGGRGLPLGGERAFAWSYLLVRTGSQPCAQCPARAGGSAPAAIHPGLARQTAPLSACRRALATGAEQAGDTLRFSPLSGRATLTWRAQLEDQGTGLKHGSWPGVSRRAGPSRSTTHTDHGRPRPQPPIQLRETGLVTGVGYT